MPYQWDAEQYQFIMDINISRLADEAGDSVLIELGKDKSAGPIKQQYCVELRLAIASVLSLLWVEHHCSAEVSQNQIISGQFVHCGSGW